MIFIFFRNNFNSFDTILIFFRNSFNLFLKQSHWPEIVFAHFWRQCFQKKLIACLFMNEEADFQDGLSAGHLVGHFGVR